MSSSVSQVAGIILAGGKGERMESDKPKVLHEVCGRPMVEYVIDVLIDCGIERILVVVGYGADDVKATLPKRSQVQYVLQPEQNGTGDAVKCCVPFLRKEDDPVLIVTGDSPLIQRDSVKQLLASFEQDRPACLLGTLHKENPFGLGRILRGAKGGFLGIKEEKDASLEQRKITEVNMSTYVFDAAQLLHALGEMKPKNVQNEYYLTDCPGILHAEGKAVRALPVLKPCEALSINTLEELAIVDDEMRRQLRNP